MFVNEFVVGTVDVFFSAVVRFFAIAR